MSDQEKQILLNDLLDSAKNLVDKLEDVDLEASRDIIQSLYVMQNGEDPENPENAGGSELYQQLGKLTREFHNTLSGIQEDVSAQNGIHDAQNNLSYVISLTEQAANTTMDGIEKTIPMSNDLAKEAAGLLETWGRFKRRELTIEEFRELYKEMLAYLERVQSTGEEIHEILQAVLVAQEYQDLSGQAIRKVINTVAELEKKLVNLIALAAESGLDIRDDKKEPAAEPDKMKQRVSGQNEVDDLLSELGF